eukprot:TRINITY_DN2045_c0_g1_i9.p2 TRINITY_DN2045_c0_g1~~TRINITY_DN2045_c0_g1_i9.p2  ORF type:complete len:406 (+),score=124.54 TRINITY_DN2045_c0_g1_i9:79-1296(+)
MGGHKEPTFLSKLNEALNSGGGSVLLLVAAIFSLVLANVDSTKEQWTGLWQKHAGPELGGHQLTLKLWVNEGLMTFFFFAVGLEIKAELVEGALSSVGKAMLPCIAALGGMVAPMAVYMATQMMMAGGDASGITIPTATDIAFAMGVFTLFRKSMPESMAPFILALATVDDLGAIGIIIVTGGGTLKMNYIFATFAILAASAWLGSRGLKDSSIRFVIPGVSLWYCMLIGGVNADVAGVLIAMCIPLHNAKGDHVIHDLVELWTPISAMIVLPLFALANCAVPIGGGGGSLAVPAGVGLGLLLGKPLGIWGFTGAAVQMGLELPKGLTMNHVAAVGMLGGVGFTMCLFLVENALSGPVAEVTKVVVLCASSLAAMLACVAMAAIKPAASKVADVKVVPNKNAAAV